ncbi:MAG: biotin transporter BioY [Bacteroidia bacterium]
MQTRKNDSRKLKTIQKQLLMVIAFVVLVGLGARINVDSGVLTPFTLQTFFLGIVFYFSTKGNRIVAVLSYILLGIIGLPLFLEGASGIEYFKSNSVGFFVGFVMAAFATPKGQSYVEIFTYFIIIHFIIVLFGLLGLAAHQLELNEITEIAIALIPGMVIKSLAGAAVIYGLLLLGFNSSYTR